MLLAIHYSSTKMNITKSRKIWMTLSATLVVVSIALVSMFGFNLGLDFLGGIRWESTIQTDAETNATQADIENFFAGIKSEGLLTKQTKIQSTDTGDFLITLENTPDENFDAIKNKLAEQFTITDKSFRRVDTSIGASFKQKAFYAILAALAGIIFFVAWAFRKIPASVSPWRFGGVAIAALFHDILVILAVFTVLGAIVGTELDLQFITALLATLGFSVNDTIVILDRVRENITKQKMNETFEDTVEKSIQQTLQRSINTSISTLLPLVGLLFFGASSIFYFILALTIGIVVGTYSSIFLAAPLLVTWKNLAQK